LFEYRKDDFKRKHRPVAENRSVIDKQFAQKLKAEQYVKNNFNTIDDSEEIKRLRETVNKLEDEIIFLRRLLLERSSNKDSVKFEAVNGVSESRPELTRVVVDPSVDKEYKFSDDKCDVSMKVVNNNKNKIDKLRNLLG
jgi:hypothetical protein